MLEADRFEGGAGPGVPGTRVADIAVDHFRVAVADLSSTLVDEGEEEPEIREASCPKGITASQSVRHSPRVRHKECADLDVAWW